jgi:hypothetical protein
LSFPIGGICRKIAADIRARYTIGYVPVRSGAARFAEDPCHGDYLREASWSCTPGKAIFPPRSHWWTGTAKRTGKGACEAQSSSRRRPRRAPGASFWRSLACLSLCGYVISSGRCTRPMRAGNSRGRDLGAATPAVSTGKTATASRDRRSATLGLPLRSSGGSRSQDSLVSHGAGRIDRNTAGGHRPYRQLLCPASRNVGGGSSRYLLSRPQGR